MNALIVRDRASMLQPYKTLVEVLDRAADMVQIDAFIIDIRASRLDEFGLGLSWAGTAAAAGATGTNNSQVTRTLNPGGLVPSGANVILQAARGVQLLAQIRALETQGDSEVLTVPSVVTLNNLEATFSARQNFFVKVTGNQDASLTRVTAETLLRVTPLVAQAGGGAALDRRIRLLISVQDGSVDASQAATVDNLPRTLENQISTQAVVRGGDTLVIGGQVVRKRVNRVSGLPIIKDIPLLGALTNSRSDDYEQYVRIYVVRPRLLGEDSADTKAPDPENRIDPASHGVLERVPELIRGTGLTPRRADPPPADQGSATGPNGQSVQLYAPTQPTVVVPVPAPMGVVRTEEGGPADQPDRGAEGGSRAPQDSRKGGSSSQTSQAEEDPAAGWNPDDPIWRPPGSPLGRLPSTSGAPLSRPANGSTPGRSTAPSTGAVASPPGSKIDQPTQAARDRDARRILEAELLRAERTLVRLEQESSQGNSAVREALERTRADVSSIKAELARLGVQSGDKSSPSGGR
jgi:hypothetical protein